MRIEQIEIYGFGKWIDQTFMFNKTTCIEIAGDNEAGKSTLRQFILYVLFGMKTKELERYIPKQGSVIGGRLTITGLSEQTVTIERVQGKQKNQAVVYGSDGMKMDEVWLMEALQGIDKEQFQSIYTFDAHDLQQVQHIDGEALHDILLAIGMTGSNRIYYAEKNIEKQTAELFKPYGKKPELNQLFQELSVLQQKWDEAKAEEAKYRSYLAEIENSEAKLSEWKQEQKAVDDQLGMIEKRLSHYPIISEYYFVTAELNRHDQQITFPVDGIDRLNEWKETLLPLQSEAQVLQNSKEELENKISTTTLLPSIELDEVKQGVQLQQEIAEIKQNIKEKEKLHIEMEKEITNKLNSLQIQLDIPQLQGMDFPFYLEEAWSELGAQLDKLTVEKQYVGSDLASTAKLKQERQQEKARLEQSARPVRQIEQWQQELEDAEQQETYNKQQKKFQQWQQAYAKQHQTASIVLIVGVLLAGILLVTSFLNGSLMVLILSVVQYGAVRIYGKTFRKWLQPEQSNNVNWTQSDITERKEALNKQQKIQEQLRKVEKDIQHYQLEQLKLEERISFIEERIQQVEQKITDHQEDYPFLEQVALPYWTRLYQQLILQKEKLEIWNDQQNELNEWKEIQISKQKALQHLSVKAENLSHILANEEGKQQQLREWKARLEEISFQLEAVQKRQVPYQQEIAQLLDKAAVDTEEAFIEKGEYYAKVQHLTQQSRQTYDRLAVLFTNQSITEFSKGSFEDEQVLQQQRAELIKKRDALSNNMNEEQSRLSDQKANVALLERNEDVSVLKHQIALKQEEAESIAKKWSVYQLAWKSLQQAKSSYSQKYMPKVFNQASQYFKQLTLQRYLQILIEDNQRIIVEDKDGYLFSIDELSQATRDQLYIALRFALSQVMSETLAMPFLIDDGFVHFDNKRKKEMLTLVNQISQDHQVLYFTANATEKASITL
ncbi:AAA family ATPase [Gracilibacillus caseinilyticus]|uniref:AAA family ATPase n=1 Tax=Gracilibacillus caseinilyticus TaxID=2932256 RepID=A0ABY4ERI3_9BACI|nr:AAA family ATPase [Gracilibacillus caseinilyticus]UOQ46798.1 AAA family ATPase [Gracilibacillus caseinilyticus]